MYVVLSLEFLFLVIEIRKETTKPINKSIHIQFDTPKPIQRDFEQMAEISSSSKSPEQELSLREIGVETSIEYEKIQQIINIVQEKEEEFK